MHGDWNKEILKVFLSLSDIILSLSQKSFIQTKHSLLEELGSTSGKSANNFWIYMFQFLVFIISGIPKHV